ncbi:MAG: 4Fe-4S dicluster domain-containing protein [Candidatus Calescibacterium sp.]|nr:4Fe-4S dicluster domain-containing protein [Candidatus Calescibacterium sp.]
MNDIKNEMNNGGKKENIDISRRNFFKFFGKSSVAVGTVALIESCVKKPEPEKLLPYLNVPETIIPGVPYFYATTCSGCPASCGILVKTEDAIPRKVEGNPEHPLSGGKTCARAQATLHQLYSPDRIKDNLIRGKTETKTISTDEVIQIIADKIKEADPKKIFFITGNITGKTEKFYLDFATNFGIPYENIIRWETFSFSGIRKASELLFGVQSVPIFRIDKSDFILSLSADFLDSGPSTVLYTRWFGQFISVDEKAGRKNKFVHVSPRLNLTGQNAQKWIKVKPGGEVVFASLLLNKIIDEKFSNYSYLKIQVPAGLQEKYNILQKDIDFVAKLLINSSSPLVIPPSYGAEDLTSLCLVSLLINYVLGSYEKNISLEGFSYSKLATYSEISSFIQKAKNKQVDILFVMNNFDLVYTIPDSFGIKSALSEIPFVVSFAYHQNETSDFSHLVVADLHPFERWGDSEIVNGLISFYQPVIRPMYQKLQSEDILIAVANKLKEGSFNYQSFKDYMFGQYGFSDEQIVKYLELGGVFNFDLAQKPVSLKSDVTEVIGKLKFNEVSDGLNLIAYVPYHIYDGRLANSPWMQQFFDVSNRVSWTNSAEMSKKTAQKLGVKNGDIIEIEKEGKKIELPVAVYYGIVDDVIAVSVGRGHKKYGRFANTGANVFDLIEPRYDQLSGDLSFFVPNISVSKTTKKLRRLPTDQGVPRTLGRGVAFFTSVQKLPEQDYYKKFKDYEKLLKKRFPKGDIEKYNRDSAKPSPYKWGLVVDLDKCIGCQACVIACQVENNIPFVDQKEVIWGREISWVRVERYFVSPEEIEHKGEHHNGHNGKESDELYPVFVPMMCQQCDHAPCEYVCPVYATGHTSDGLNYQAYNRCVGTRFCANNCPYKVRYFNWHDYYKNIPEPLTMGLNPEVTVRSKGVMEKCTFCIQRIKYAEHNAKVEKREVRDGEITPACAQVCPTDAITFGNLKSESSKVSQVRKSKRADWSLKELGTDPAVTYLEKVFDLEILKG